MQPPSPRLRRAERCRIEGLNNGRDEDEEADEDEEWIGGCLSLSNTALFQPANSSSHKEWIEALSTAMAASLRDSERVGWAVTVRAMSSALP